MILSPEPPAHSIPVPLPPKGYLELEWNTARWTGIRHGEILVGMLLTALFLSFFRPAPTLPSPWDGGHFLASGFNPWRPARGALPVAPCPWRPARGALPVAPCPWRPARGALPVVPCPWRPAHRPRHPFPFPNPTPPKASMVVGAGDPAPTGNVTEAPTVPPSPSPGRRSGGRRCRPLNHPTRPDLPASVIRSPRRRFLPDT